MDIKKIGEIIEDSKLTDEAKDYILKLLPDADKTEIIEEIMKTFEFEIKMNQLDADEAQEIMDKIEDGEKMIDAADGVASELAEELESKTNEKLAALDIEKDEVEKSMQSDAAPVAEPVVEPVTPAPAAPASTWNPVVEPVAQPQNSWNQPVAPVTPVQAAPVSSWNQPATTEQPATQPAPFPGSQTGQV